MAIVKIKYSDLTSTPVELQEGELAYSNKSGNLYVGLSDGTVQLVNAGTSTAKFQLTEPTSPGDGDVWLNTSNQQLLVYQNGVWGNVVFKHETASDFGAVTMNGGYF